MDTNILLGIAFSSKETQRDMLRRVLRKRSVLLSERASEEARKVAGDLSVRRHGTDLAVSLLLPQLRIVNNSQYMEMLPAACECLRLAVPSLNGSTSDGHILASAWATGSDIWSGDRDFAGTGWPSWSSANLLRALDQEI